MESSRWARVRVIFDEVADLPPGDRPAALAARCGGEREIEDEVRSLLAARAASDGFLETPAGALAAGRSLFDEFDSASRESAGGVDGAEGAPRASGALAGQRLGPFRVLGLLGEGGMGTVYRAEQERPRRMVALKVISASRTSAALVKRFELESQILGRLRHPGIAQVYEAGSVTGADGRAVPYFAMELVDGPPLMAFAAQRGLSIRERLDLFALICDAVEHAHQKGVIHRDLKPANILVEGTATSAGDASASGTGSSGGTSGVRSYQPKILDFGVARLAEGEAGQATMQTHAGQVIGTLRYMSPEQVRGESHEVDTRSDVYALGVILYELVTGRAPLDLSGAGVVQAAKVIGETVPALAGVHERSLRGDGETIIAKALEKEAARRYQSAAALAADVRRYLVGEPISARPASAMYHFQRLVQRHRAISALVGLIVVGSMGFGTGMAWLFRVADAQRSDAVASRQKADAEAEKARAEAENARAVAGFMASVFARARPTSPGDAKLSAVDLLDAATRKLAAQPPAKPEIGRELYIAIAGAYDGLGELERGREFLLKAKGLTEQTLGRNNRTYATIVSDLAELARKQGRFEEAREHVREYAALQAGLFDSGDHIFSDGPAMLAWEIGDFETAEPIFRETLARARGARASPTVLARLLSNYAGVLVETGRFAEAERMVREAVDIWRSSTQFLAKPSLGSGLNNLAWTLYRQDKLEEGEGVAREALALQTSIFGADHAAAASVETTLGAILAARGATGEALPMLRHALATRERSLPPSSDQTGETRRLLGRALLSAGDAEGSLAVAERGLSFVDESPRGVRTRADLLALLAEIHDRRGDASASAAARRALEDSRPGVGPSAAPR